MAKKVLTPEQAEVKAIKKARKSVNFSAFIAIVLAVVLTVGVVVIADKTSSNIKVENSNNTVDNSSDIQTEDNATDEMDSEMIIGDNGTITIVGGNEDSTDKEESESKKELSANPAEWSKEEIVAVYKNSAAKSHKVVQSSQVYAMPKLIVNDGDGALGFFLKVITPVIASVLEKNATTYEGVTGGYTKMVPSDVQSAKAYKDGDYIVIEMVMVEQTDGIYGDYQGGSVGHAINVLGNVATAVEQFPAFDIKFEEADIKIHYTNPTVKVKINKDGIIEKGTWSYDSQIYIRNLQIDSIMINKADAEIIYTITTGGGF
ncbi:MAG: hypothetical protein IKV25_06935 [Clostridia bacterium]|nr:hypothetical protein [Clostridia bacterium]